MYNESISFHITDLYKTFENGYQKGFLDGIDFILKLFKDEKILKVFKDGNILK